MFGTSTWDDTPFPGAYTEGGAQAPRTFTYIRDHQSCSFCRLTYHGLKDADNWYHVDEWTVWLSTTVYAWILGGTEGHNYHSRVEKKFGLRIQRDSIGLEEGWDQNKQKEVMTEQVAQIQVFARQSNCSNKPTWYEAVSRYKAKGCTDIFKISDYDYPEDKEFVDNAHVSACRGRWIPKDEIDFDMVKQWLWLCDNFHDEQCRPESQLNRASQHFPSRVIDVHRGCVVNAPTGC